MDETNRSRLDQVHLTFATELGEPDPPQRVIAAVVVGRGGCDEPPDAEAPIRAGPESMLDSVAGSGRRDPSTTRGRRKVVAKLGEVRDRARSTEDGDVAQGSVGGSLGDAPTEPLSQHQVLDSGEPPRFETV